MLLINLLHLSLKEAMVLGRKREYKGLPLAHLNQVSEGKTLAEK